MTGSVGSVVIVGPLAPFGDAYRAELTVRGYASRTVVNQLRQVARLSCWLQVSGLSVSDLSRARVEEFLAARRAAGQRATGPGLMCLLDVLRSIGALEAEAPTLRMTLPPIHCWCRSGAICCRSEVLCPARLTLM